MVTSFSINQLIKKKIHIGHILSEWVPNLSKTLFNIRDDIHFIDLQQTIFLFRRALGFLNCIENSNYKLLFLERETNKSRKNIKYYVDNKYITKNKNILRECAIQYSHFYLSDKLRGGVLNNIRSSKINKDNYIPNKNIMPNIFLITNISYYESIILESFKVNFILIGLLDTNNSNFGLTYPIPCNDDNYYSINFFYNLVINSIDNSSLFFNKNFLLQYRTNIINNYYSNFWKN